MGVGTGTDAIALILRALGIGPGDEVITTPLSAAYSALAIMMAGARPVFADIDPRAPDDRSRADRGARSARGRAPSCRCICTGSRPTWRRSSASPRGTISPIVEDCCQAHLATSGGRPVGTIGVAGAFSFYPTKNLGALGDGGAVVTNDRALADRIKRLRNGGQTDRYHHEEPGVNSRLDEMQAAILRARLPFLRGWTDRAPRARGALSRGARRRGPVEVPPEMDAGHVYHLFVVRSRRRRGDLQAQLAADGIETLIHYPVPDSRASRRSPTPGPPTVRSRTAPAKKSCRCRSILG